MSINCFLGSVIFQQNFPSTDVFLCVCLTQTQDEEMSVLTSSCLCCVWMLRLTGVGSDASLQ